MQSTEYKGFTIFTLANGRFYINDTFNRDGYATLNNAKGAITKHLNAPKTVEPDNPALEASLKSNWPNGKSSKAASAPKAATTSTPAPEVMKAAAKSFGEKVFAKTVAEEAPKAAKASSPAPIQASIPTGWESTATPPMSRRQREGRTFVKAGGKILRTPVASLRHQDACAPRTRKQRKEHKRMVQAFSKQVVTELD